MRGGVIVHARPCGGLQGASWGPSALPIREEVLLYSCLLFRANQNFESLVGCIIMPAIGETFQARGSKEWIMYLCYNEGLQRISNHRVCGARAQHHSTVSEFSNYSRVSHTGCVSSNLR